MMKTETEMQLSAMTNGQLAIAAAAQMRNFDIRMADIQQRVNAIKLCPDKAALMPALIDNAVTLSTQLNYVIEACEL